jgi:hypothetical protein
MVDILNISDMKAIMRTVGRLSSAYFTYKDLGKEIECISRAIVSHMHVVRVAKCHHGAEKNVIKPSGFAQ